MRSTARVAETVSRLRTTWNGTVAAPYRRLALTVIAAATLLAAHLARIGTDVARAIAAAAVLLVVAAAVVLLARRRRALRDPRNVIATVGGRTDPERAARAIRALGLVDRTGAGDRASSRELAELHLERQLAGFSELRVRAAAEREARRIGFFRLFAALVFLASFAFATRWLEGFDVLFAQNHVAPMPLPYLEDGSVHVHPPDYLHDKDVEHDGFSPTTAPYGSVVTVRAKPHWLFGGRRLVLTDGKTEVPFVDDGAGGITARWVLAGSVTLDVAARHGDVSIPDGQPLEVRSIPDRAPVVTVKDAPRRVELLKTPEIPVVYDATDDHGIREVDLVLRAGPHEERRVLSKLDAETIHDSGGYTVRSSQSFVKSSYLPIEVTVEAKDNDPLTGPKWGTSAAIIIVPPAIGEAEAMRYDALVRSRDALVDLLAWETRTAAPPKDKKAFSEEEMHEVETALGTIERELSSLPTPAAISRRLRAFVDGQRAKLKAAADADRDRATKESHAKLTTATEDVILALDRALRTLGTRDAQSSARKLSRVATEAADGFQLTVSTIVTEAERGKQRADAALTVIEPSGKALARLGPLGADLGEIVANDLRRIHGAERVNDWFHAELAARDLAARLARPDPSFSGGGGGRGTESGNGKPEPGEEADSDAEQSFESERGAIESLGKDHAANMDDVEQALRDAMNDEELKQLAEEAKKHAKAVRDAVSKLPRFADDDGTDTGAAVRAAEQAEQMAEALERGDWKGAVEAGRAAERSLDVAKKLADDDRLGERTGKLAEGARSKLSPEVRWSEEMRDKLQKKLDEKASTGAAGEREERLAERTKEIREKGRGASGSLPESTAEALRQAEEKMRQAAKELKDGRAERGLEHQRAAQRMLEQASPRDDEQQQEGDDGGRDHDVGGKTDGMGPANIPKGDEHKGPEEFRRRVLEGLAKGQTTRLQPALRRYAEKLLR